MTYVHIAVFKWKAKATESEIDEAMKEVAALAAKVPGVIEIWAGKNESRYSEGYTHAVLVRAQTQEAIDAYRAHPDHVRVAKVIDDMEEHGVGVDFVTDLRGNPLRTR